MISSPSECAVAKRPDQTCYRLEVSTIGSKDIVLEYTVPKTRCDGCGCDVAHADHCNSTCGIRAIDDAIRVKPVDLKSKD
jgi:hypothetical protein